MQLTGGFLVEDFVSCKVNTQQSDSCHYHSYPTFGNDVTLGANGRSLETLPSYSFGVAYGLNDSI